MTEQTNNLSADRKLTFDEIQQQASCAWKLKKLGKQLAINHPCDMAGPLGDYEASDYTHLAETLEAIESVLKLLRSIPNAYINREALDAFQDHIRQARQMLAQEWVEKLLATPGELSDNEIPW